MRLVIVWLTSKYNTTIVMTNNPSSMIRIIELYCRYCTVIKIFFYPRDPEDMEKCMNSQPHAIDGKTVELSRATPK